MRIVPRLGIIALATVSLFCATAMHAETINFSYTGDGITASGTFFTDAPVGDVYTVTGITGTRNGQTIDGIAPFVSSDNQVSLTSPYFDLGGVSYAIGDTDYNIFYDETGISGVVGVNECSLCDGSDTVSIAFTDSLATPAVPEPSSIVLCGTGLLGFAGAVRRRFSRS